jgi:hypothetical protein
MIKHDCRLSRYVLGHTAQVAWLSVQSCFAGESDDSLLDESGNSDILVVKNSLTLICLDKMLLKNKVYKNKAQK